MDLVRLGRSAQLSAASTLAVALALAAFAYSHAISGGLHFDDPANLSGLADIRDARSALEFVLDGDAGPSGRPIALASFVPQAYAWPNAPEVFLYTNVCLHLLNGVLVAWLLCLLGTASGRTSREAGWAGTLAGAFWILSPLLASSSLLIVQRMTTLSAMFLLAGFIAYLYSRRRMEHRPAAALVLMSLSVGIFTCLAVFTKENGALLPVLILVTEATLLPPPSKSGLTGWWRCWCGVFLLAPTVALLCYLVLRLPYSHAVYVIRGFTGSERIVTEAAILWQYLYHAFLPATSALGPFHDDQPVYALSSPICILSLVAWVALCASAFALRRRAPLLAFAVAWYLAGHALESTTVPLELYFEHRNYVPLIGPMYALVATALTAAPRWQMVIRPALAAYAALLTIVLFDLTSLWGQPRLASRIWAQEHPDSERATEYLARQLALAGDQQAARRVLLGYDARQPDEASIALAVLALSCVLEPKESHTPLLEHARATLQEPRFDRGTFQHLRALYDLAQRRQCDDVDRNTVYSLISTAAANRAYRVSPQVLHNLHVLMSEEAFAQRNLGLTMSHIEAALAAAYTMTTLRLAVATLDSAGLYDEARKFVAEGRHHPPQNFLRRVLVWHRQLAELEQVIDEASRHTTTEDRQPPVEPAISVVG